MPLQPIHLLMLWTSSAETDPGHSWLRRRILSLVAELDGATRAASRWLDGAQWGDTRGTGPEILLGFPGDEGGRVAAGRGSARTVHKLQERNPFPRAGEFHAGSWHQG
jgi:hypothetical protein